MHILVLKIAKRRYATEPYVYFFLSRTSGAWYLSPADLKQICHVQAAILPKNKGRGSIHNTIRSNASEYSHLEIGNKKTNFAILDSDLREAALLDTKTTGILHSLLDLSSKELSYEAVVTTSAFCKRFQATKGRQGTSFPMTLNLYGPRAVAKSVGSLLSGLSVFLQHPYSVKPQTKYENPHFWVPPGDTIDMSQFVGEESIQDKKAKLTKEMMTQLDSLGDIIYDSTVDLDIPPGLTTSLKRSCIDKIIF